MRKTTPIPHPKPRSSFSHEILLSIVEPLTENEGDGSAFPRSQHHESVRQPLNERGVPEAVVTVVGVAMNWLGAHVLQIFHRNRREGHDVHLPVTGSSRKRHGAHAFNGD